MAKKAEAWREYREAAMVDMLLDTLPKVRMQHSYNISNIEDHMQKKKISNYIIKFLGRCRGCCTIVTGQENHNGIEWQR